MIPEKKPDKHIVPFSEEEQNYSLPTESHDRILEFNQSKDEETGIDSDEFFKDEESGDKVSDEIKFERTKTFIERTTQSRVIFKSRKLENLWPS